MQFEAKTQATCLACPLSPRQVEVVSWMAEGKTAAEIGIILGVTTYTVQTYIASAKDSAGAHKETSLVATALRKGWIA